MFLLLLNPNPEDDEDVRSECPIEEEENEEEVVVNPVEVEVVEHEFGVQKADIPLIVRQYPGLFFFQGNKKEIMYRFVNAIDIKDGLPIPTAGSTNKTNPIRCSVKAVAFDFGNNRKRFPCINIYSNARKHHQSTQKEKYPSQLRIELPISVPPTILRFFDTNSVLEKFVDFGFCLFQKYTHLYITARVK